MSGGMLNSPTAPAAAQQGFSSIRMMDLARGSEEKSAKKAARSRTDRGNATCVSCAMEMMDLARATEEKAGRSDDIVPGTISPWRSRGVVLFFMTPGQNDASRFRFRVTF